VTAHIARTTLASVPSGMSPKARAGYLLTKGMQGAEEGQKVGMMVTIAKDPEAREGAKAAVLDTARAREPWWAKFKRFFGFG